METAMSRPKGWKPLSYTTLARICAKLVKGESRTTIAKECNIKAHTIGCMKRAMEKEGLKIASLARSITPEQDSAVLDMIRNTRMTNQEIAAAVGLSSTCVPRFRRRRYYQELAEAGEPVPLCECGDVFQHPQRCNYRQYRRSGRGLHEIDETEREEIRAKYRAGVSSQEVKKAHHLGPWAAQLLWQQMSSHDQRARKRNYVHPKVRRRRRAAATHHADGLLHRLRSCFPSHTDPLIREEAIQTMIVEILSGQVTEQKAIVSRSSYVRRAYAQTSDRRMLMSLDDTNLFDQIADESSLDPLEHLCRKVESDWS